MQQRDERGQGRGDISLRALMVSFNHEESFGRFVPGRAPAALAPAPAAGDGLARLVDEDDFAGLRSPGFLASQVIEVLVALRLGYGDFARDQGCIDHEDRESVADAREVTDIDQWIDRRDLALLSQAPQQCLRRVAMLRGRHAEGAEHPTPGCNARDLREGRRAKLRANRLLLSCKSDIESRDRTVGVELACEDYPGPETGESGEDTRVVTKHGRILPHHRN